MSAPPPVSCSVCNNLRHVRGTAGRWQRCAACYSAVTSQTFVQAPLKLGESDLDARWLDREPWPLADHEATGSFDDFRHMAWRSLLHIALTHPALYYACVESSRLGEIAFERDPQYSSIYSLVVDYQLLILIARPHGMINTYTPRLVDQIRLERRNLSKPTWCYRANGGSVVTHDDVPVPARSRAAQQALLE